ncbi:Serine/threonine protein kinase [Parafrankia irregularis]|uniref:non-specific serine/threonine protein kinase n=1 Tax=Parafrankia irregularis TaxID=795642 RepID=A0A0S4QKW5_9ACTN|nr:MULTISPECIES: protein kinase [Parafrankia]MBE3203969.1 protein kinase [Parafrankia sp. CH37]CUU55158.1 Serine/threonine protein kinase [Parafrankia irregularis]
MIFDRGWVERALPAYRVGEQLGSGSFGAVLAGEHRWLDRRVAIKVMAGDGTAGAASGFAEEAKALEKLKHPHVLHVHDYVEAEGLCLVVMELMAGGTLADRLLGMTPEQACGVGLAVAAALEHAHSHKMLHRDIKPENILFGADGTPVVGDFGLVKMFEGSAATASGSGTPLYMAPEQIQGGRLGPGVDLYALGVVLYQLLVGTPPFGRDRQSVPAVMFQHLTQPPPPMTGVAAPLADVVLRALAKSPADRHRDAPAFALDLARAATKVFGPGWAARTGLSLHLLDTVRRFALHPRDPFDSGDSRPGTVTDGGAGGRGGAERPSWDFFVSYARADRAWAEWIAGQLVAAGHRVLLQAWDETPVPYWSTGMFEGTVYAAHTLALLSPAYLETVLGRPEWNAASGSDGARFARTLIPVRIADCPWPDLPAGGLNVDLTGTSADETRRILLDQLDAARSGSASGPARTEIDVAPTPVGAPAINSLIPPQRHPAGGVPSVPPVTVTTPVTEPTPASEPASEPEVAPASEPEVAHAPASEPAPDAAADLDTPGPVSRRERQRARRRRSRRRTARLATICGVVLAVLAVSVGAVMSGNLFGGTRGDSSDATGSQGSGGTVKLTPVPSPPTTVVTPTMSPTPTAVTSAVGSTAPVAPTTSPASRPTDLVTTTRPPTVTRTTAPPVNSAQAAPAGPGSGDRYQEGSQVSVSGCTGWLNFEGVLYGKLSAGAGSCVADVIVNGEANTSSSTKRLEASNYATANSKPGSFLVIGYYSYSERICVWNAADPGGKRCSPTFVDTQGKVSRR